ncbi:MAG: hypothetical protein WA885_14915 [Phormidesmis sp.]
MFFSLIAGLVMAFAFQLLLTSLGAAIGLSFLGWAIAPPSNEPETDSVASNGKSSSPTIAGSSTPPITHLFGLGVTLSIAPVLFAASFLAASLLAIDISGLSPGGGFIFGIILWASYLLIVTWLSSITLSGLVEFALGSAATGLRRLWSTVGQTIKPSSNHDRQATQSDSDNLQVVITELVDAVSQQQQIPELLAQQREELLAEICDRTGLATAQAETVLEEVQPTGSTTLKKKAPDWRSLLRSVANRADLSDWDIEKVWDIFQSLTPDETASEDSFNIVQLDVENYLREAPKWSLQADDTLKHEFTERLCDPEAEPALMLKQIQPITSDNFTAWLQQREDLTPDTIENVSEKLSALRSHVLATLEAKKKDLDTAVKTEKNKQNQPSQPQLSEAQQATFKVALSDIESKLISYFRYTALDKLTADSTSEKLQALLEENALLNADGCFQAEQIGSSGLNIDAIAEVIDRRRNIDPQQVTELTKALKDAWQSHYPSTQTALPTKITNYVKSIDWSEIELDDFKSEIAQQLKAGLSGHSDFSNSINLTDLIKSLDIPPSVKTDLEHWLKAESKTLLKQPRRWAKRAAQTSQQWASQLTQQVSNYLQHQKQSAFTPEEILQDISQIVKATAQTIPQKLDDLPQLDSSVWQQALAHRPDLTPIEGQAIIDNLTAAWETVSAEVLPSLSQWESALQSTTQALKKVADGGAVEPVIEHLLEPALEQVSTAVLEPAKQQFIEAINTAQAKAQSQALAVAESLRESAEDVRHQVAIATWWLFISLLAAGTASAGAGWLAIRYPIA